MKLIAVALLMVMPPLAETKGPVAATIEGAGQNVRVVMNDGKEGQLLTELLDVTGFFGISNVRQFEPAPATPGPAYMVTYDVGGGAVFRQVLHPTSSAGSMIYTPGQLVHGQRVSGGWLEAPVNLGLFLRRFGITVPTPTPTVLPPEPRAAVTDDGAPGWLVPSIAGISALVLVAAGVYIVRRRSSVRA